MSNEHVERMIANAIAREIVNVRLRPQDMHRTNMIHVIDHPDAMRIARTVMIHLDRLGFAITPKKAES